MGELYIVATPIGNLSDITLRALQVLKSVDFILSEDTRVSQKLLNHYEIKKPLIAYHQHSLATSEQKLIKLLAEGKNLALVTDAGTPGVSDPGGRLIEAVLKANPITKIIPIPGASALTSLISVAGIKLDHFLFLGFLPHKKGRQTTLKTIAQSDKPIIVYESKHRLLKLLDELNALIPKTELIVGRELTKIHETIYRGTASAIAEILKNQPVAQKGEFVLIINQYGQK